MSEMFDLGGSSIVALGVDSALDKKGPTKIVEASGLSAFEYAARLRQAIAEGDVPFVDMAAILEADEAVHIRPIPVKEPVQRAAGHLGLLAS